MEELDKNIQENEFLNILGEQESTLANGIILGASDSSSSGSTKGSDTCDSDGSCKNEGCKDQGSCTTDGICTSQGSTANYYFVAGANVMTYGYYKNNPSNSDYYSISTCKFVYASTSGMSTILTAAAYSHRNDSCYNLTQHSRNIWFSGASAVNPLGASTTGTMGLYVTMYASSLTHAYQSFIVPFKVYSFPSSNSGQFTTIANSMASNSTIYPQNFTANTLEKIFDITVSYVSGSAPVTIQGADVSISQSSSFPQLTSGIRVKTGTDGKVVLATSSFTGTTINGYINRKGFNGNNNYAFNAGMNQSTIVTLPVNNVEAEKQIVSTSDIYNNINDYIIDNLPNHIASMAFQNWTVKQLNNQSMSVVTRPGVSLSDTNVLRYSDIIKITPGAANIYNDVVLGKPSSLSYNLRSTITLNTSYQLVASFTATTTRWYTDYTYNFMFPTIQYSSISTDSSIPILIKYEIDSVQPSAGLTTGTCEQEIVNAGYYTNFAISKTLSYATLRSIAWPSGSVPHYYFTIKMYFAIEAAPVGTIKALGGTYYYSYTVQDNTIPR